MIHDHDNIFEKLAREPRSSRALMAIRNEEIRVVAGL